MLSYPYIIIPHPKNNNPFFQDKLAIPNLFGGSTHRRIGSRGARGAVTALDFWLNLKFGKQVCSEIKAKLLVFVWVIMVAPLTQTISSYASATVTPFLLGEETESRMR